MLPHTPGKEEEFPFLRTFKMEGSISCQATTPIGHAVACNYKQGLEICDSRQTGDPNRCDIVYMGHNVLGAEFNFLPTPYLLHCHSLGQSVHAQPSNVQNNIRKKAGEGRRPSLPGWTAPLQELQKTVHKLHPTQSNSSRQVDTTIRLGR